MAQKKVILKDGSDDLLPKTLASMVFTEAGQTVEAALQSAGGGSSSGGGTGNVNVTNGSSLQKDAYYAFQPSAEGSLTGKFATLPYASSTAAGLMSPSNYDKLDAIKEERELPSSVVSLSSSSTELEVQKAMYELIGGTWSDIEGNDNIKLIVALYWGALIQNVAGFAIDYTYNHSRISLVPTYTPPASGEGNQYQKASLELTYVSSGRLRTVTLTATLNSSGETATYDFTAKVEESGDDMYWLPYTIFDLDENSTAEDVFEKFGGEGEFKKLWVYVPNRKFYIPYLDDYNRSNFINVIPASVRAIMPLSWQLDISALIPEGALTETYPIIRAISIVFSFSSWKISSFTKRTIRPDGYPLNPSLYSLTSSSSSDDISSAVGGESGLKEIIQAVKDGNRLVIRGTMESAEDGTSLSTDVVMNTYTEKENGDLAINYSLFGAGQGGGYYGGSYYVINYTKSSNTFSIQKNAY